MKVRFYLVIVRNSYVILYNLFDSSIKYLFTHIHYLFLLTGSVFRLVTTFCLVLALAQLISYLLVLIVGEKEKKLKEGMKMMGLRDSVYW